MSGTETVREPRTEPLRADHHTHTRFSDGRDSLERTVEAASAAGLRALFVTDHVRADTSWLPAYTAAVRAVDSAAPLAVVCGVETKIVDTSGALDLPADTRGVAHIAIADHRFPLTKGSAHPDTVRELLHQRRLTATEAVESLIEATVRAVTAVAERADGGRGVTGHVAHPFSVLPKVGLTEEEIPPAALLRLARACRVTNIGVEVNEKWRCPSLPTALELHRAGVSLVAGSDAHEADSVGRWEYTASVFEALSGCGTDSTPPERS
ncbi:putative hydrolase [Actinopolyspora lacussalsi subsp. righensis]|uniref:Putative hydrolase n=1 Tax=Actinopolyspora righensis TaxID=995060 RepID=A0A1I6X6H5_9ACTN|nr:PHP domain-containing protein [Actinopolyspora righensis]SFT33817.1 putative hydrolase [Actinopolyspora righensis]